MTDKDPFKSDFDESELESLLNLELDEITEHKWNVLDQIEVQEILQKIPRGLEGLELLKQSEEIKKVDKSLEDKQNQGGPRGDPLNRSIKQISVSERTEAYKSGIQRAYNLAVENTKVLYHRLIKGDRIQYSQVVALIEEFYQTFLFDKNILLNISSLESTSRDYLFNHAVNVCLLSLNIAASAKYSREQVLEIGAAGLLIDIGMMAIPADIRFSVGALTKEETFEIHKHPILGYHIASKIAQIPEGIPVVMYQHHERLDGSGYPKQRIGRFIHHYARIVAIADIYEAVASRRSFKPRKKPYSAMETLLKIANKGQIDANYVKDFIQYMSLFPVGSLVKLQSGRIGKVVHANPNEFTKPIVSILTTSKGDILPTKDIYQLDLLRNKTDKVIEALDFADGSQHHQEVMTGF